MTAQTKATLKGYFNTWDKPTEANFTDLIDSWEFFGSNKDMSIKYDWTNWIIKTDEVWASDLQIVTWTDKTVVLTETVWQDLDFPIIIRTTWPNIPVVSTMTWNIQAPKWNVNDYIMCEWQELPHIWKEWTTLYFHIHLITWANDWTNRYVAFEIEHSFADVNWVLSSPATISSWDLLIASWTTVLTHKLLSIWTLALASQHIWGHIYCRLKRVASSWTAPSVDPFVSMLQAHIECDTLGSRQIGTK